MAANSKGTLWFRRKTLHPIPTPQGKPLFPISCVAFQKKRSMHRQANACSPEHGSFVLAFLPPLQLGYGSTLVH